MSRQLTTHVLRFAGLLLFQVLVLNNVELHGFISPYIYPLFILLLPFDTPRALVLLLSFVLGLSVDMFANTPGLHAAATVWMGYLRAGIINLNIPPGGYESSDKPTLASMGFSWFFVYAGISIVLHHIFYFLIEAYTLSFFLFTLLKTIGSIAVSLFLIILYQYLFYEKTRY